MKSIDWLAPRHMLSRAVVAISLVAFAFACNDESADLASPPADAAAKKNNSVQNTGSPGNSASAATDYCIADPVVEGNTWTYTITRKPGAKAISHFIIDLNNCPLTEVPLLTTASFLSATVNGVPWPLSSSEGSGTGCDLGGSPSIVKFDNLPDAPVYVIQFTLNGSFHNFLTTPAWIKAGTSCHQYEIHAPCCPG
jgi:hypothetical protein